MQDGGEHIVDAKRTQLRACQSELTEARERLDDLIERGRGAGLDDDEVADLGPVTLEIARLRDRTDRLADELDAVAAEWGLARA